MADKPVRSKFNHLQSGTGLVSFKPLPLLAQFSAVPAPVSVSTPAPVSASASTQPSQQQSQTPVETVVEKPNATVTSTPTSTESSASKSAVVHTNNPTTAPSTSSVPSKIASSAGGIASSKTAPTAPVLLTPMPYQAIDAKTFKGSKFVSLDGIQTVTREVYDKISGTYMWEACESQEEYCINFIKDKCANRRVFLVSAGGLGAKVVPKIHDLPQVYAIYIYCVDVDGHKKWAKDYSKVRVVCDDDDRFLLPVFAVDVAQTFIEWGDALFDQGNRDKAKEKYTEAHQRLSDYARHHDPAIDVDLKKKMARCQ